MKEVIYLRVSRRKVEAMTKNMPALYAGEIPVKLEIEVKDSAFREPVLTTKVVIEDWRDGIDIADVDMKESIITDKEAELIRSTRLVRMKEILEAQGFTVTKDEA